MGSIMSKYKFFNREISWLAFNHRVLQEAKDASVPLYERIKFMAIFSFNLDEFFRVRVTASMAQSAECVMLNKGPHITDAIKMLNDIMQSMEIYQDKKAPMIPTLKTTDYMQLYDL
jgi:polyphosphate kinase